jgi:hypothetical protein
MNLGGPVWHASAAPLPGIRLPVDLLQAAALLALKGVGDARLGEWEWHEWTGSAYHVRRRLNEDEQRSVGAAIDIRGTPEEAVRMANVARWLGRV